MNLRSDSEVVTWPETHFVFVEKTGPFQTSAPEAWGSAHASIAELSKQNQVTGYMSLYKRGPTIYRAGFALSAAPVDLPDGLNYEKFAGGRYTRFILTGSYMQLPQASGQAWDTVAEKKIPLRDDFAIENYINDPRTTPEDQLVTQILIPTV